MNNKPNQRIMLTKRLLKESLIEMLKNDENIYKLSIRDLCENAGINRSTFYKYYGNQFDLLREIEDEFVTDLLSYLTDAPENFRQAFCQICHRLEDNIDLARILLNGNINKDFPARIFPMAFIQEEIQKAFTRQYTNGELAYLSCYVVYGACESVRLWINKENHESPEEFAELITSITIQPNA